MTESARERVKAVDMLLSRDKESARKRDTEVDMASSIVMLLSVARLPSCRISEITVIESSMLLDIPVETASVRNMLSVT